VATLYVKEFPDDLHRRARVAAAERDETLKALVTRAVEAELERIDAERKGRR
jgi:plasmid stability protein